MNAYKKTLNLDCLKFQLLSKFNTKLTQNLSKMKPQKWLVKENEESSNPWGVWIQKFLKVKKNLKNTFFRAIVTVSSQKSKVLKTSCREFMVTKKVPFFADFWTFLDIFMNGFLSKYRCSKSCTPPINTLCYI